MGSTIKKSGLLKRGDRSECAKAIFSLPESYELEAFGSFMVIPNGFPSLVAIRLDANAQWLC